MWGQHLLLAPLSNPHGPKQTHTPCLSNGAHVTTQDWTPGTVVWLKGWLGLTHIQGWKFKQIVNLSIPFTGKWLLFYFSGTSQVIIYQYTYLQTTIIYTWETSILWSCGAKNTWSLTSWCPNHFKDRNTLRSQCTRCVTFDQIFTFLMRAIFQLAMKTSTCCCTPPILFNKKYLSRFLASPLSLSLSLAMYIYIYTAYSLLLFPSFLVQVICICICIYIDMWIPLQRPTSPFGQVPVTHSGSHLMGCHILHVY